MRALGAKRLKLSRAEQAFLVRADRLADSAVTAGLLGPHWARSAYHLGDVAFLHALQAACFERNKNMPSQQTEDQVAQLRQIVLFRPPACPVSGRDVEQVGALALRLGPVSIISENSGRKRISRRQRTTFGPLGLSKWFASRL